MNKVTLSEIAEITMGQSPKGDTCNIIGKGKPLLNGPTEFGDFFPSAKQFTTKGNKFSKKGDILFCVRGSTTGRMNWADKEYVLGRGLASIRHKKGEKFNHFLKYLIEINLNSILKSTSGSTFPNLTNDILKSFKVLIPNDIKAEKINNFLKNLDSKIELNNKINQELEQMAKTLYDYWFVQFDFPNEQGKPYKSSGGKMLYSEELKREIPAGWEVKRLDNIEPNIITGKTPSTKIAEYFNGNIPFITIDDIRQNLFIVQSERTLTEKGAETQPTKYLYPGDICVSCIGTIGVIGIVAKISQTNQQINSISLPKNHNKYFLLNALQNYFNFNNVAKKGAVLSNMNKGEFSEILILDASKDTKEEYYNKVHSIYNKIANNIKENQELTALRDWLLPMLMNGQVTVRQAHGKVVKEAEVELGSSTELSRSMVAEPNEKYGE